jgi:hypothetical protein
LKANINGFQFGYELYRSFLSLTQAGHLLMLETPESLGEGLLTLVHKVEALEGKIGT